MSALTDALQRALNVARNEDVLDKAEVKLIQEHIDSMLLMHLVNQPADGVAIPAEPAALFNSPTGRVYKPEPAIQNLPGTPAAKLEMAYATYGRGAFIKPMATLDPKELMGYPAIIFPCQIKFTIYPYTGTPRTAVYPCADQGVVDDMVNFYMSDETGNTLRVVYSVYVKPKVKP